jgi:hypothetical protein
MDEDEYDDYLYQIDLIEQRKLGQERKDCALWDQLRDEDGIRVPGCHRVLPAPTE